MARIPSTTRRNIREWLSVAEAAEEFPVSESYLRKLVNQRRELRGYRVGNRLVFRRSDLEDFLARRPIGHKSVQSSALTQRLRK